MIVGQDGISVGVVCAVEVKGGGRVQSLGAKNAGKVGGGGGGGGRIRARATASRFECFDYGARARRKDVKMSYGVERRWTLE